MAPLHLLLLLFFFFFHLHLPSSLSLTEDGLRLLEAKRLLSDPAAPSPTGSLPTPPPATGPASPAPPQVLPNLASLFLSLNSFSCALPSSSLLPCSSLSHLDLSQNEFTGPLPSSLSSLPSLLYLDLSANNFSGPVPRPSLASLPSNTSPSSASSTSPTTPSPLPPPGLPLQPHPPPHPLARRLQPRRPPPSLPRLPLRPTQPRPLHQQPLRPHPASLAALASAVQIELYTNRLSGPIPAGFSNLSALRNFDAAMNSLSGPLPDDFFLAPSLQSVHLYENDLSGPVPPTLGLARCLADLRLFSNRLSGPLPADLGRNSPLSFVDLSENSISGEIPAGICDGGALEQLLLLDNQLSGPIPASLARCRTLTRVRLQNNGLSGELAANSLSGGIAPEISAAANLSQLLISDNRFSGPIPETVGDLPNLYEFSAANNHLDGPLPNSLANLSNLGQLDLHNNSLSGELLTGIQNWNKLTQLNLAANELTGAIPPELGKLPVPAQLQNLKLNQLNLSNNRLTGTLPPLYASGAYANSFLGNPGLCGGASGPCPGRRGGVSNRRDIIWILRAIFVAAAAIFVLGLVWFSVKYRSYKKSKIRIDKSKWMLTSFHKLGFSEYEIMDCLDEDNVIGSGASGKVYKAVLSNGEAVAVKKLWGAPARKEYNNDNDNDGFEAEVATLGKIRHKNIVKLWCCCTHKECKLLVYEYMPNGSLGDLLHSSKGGLLDWPTRYKIALDAAEGLSYLHHDCVPAIVHRDVKSNNILLDGEFGAKVADFGVAKAVGMGPKSMSVIAGSCGYIAPEYAYTLRVNEKSDIYSFGVVILELVTGRRPVDPEFGEKDLVKWVCSTLEEKGIDHVFDKKLDVATFKEEMRRVLSIGLLCASSLPINRPSMRRVVKMLLDVNPDNNSNNNNNNIFNNCKHERDGKLSPYYQEDASV
uniref:non-specific serine/threonine protein kinase n=1 Tax=Ananas comosus var. bracteatus TaxID=296719 RepID=A0A6V7PUB1_ANACO|nr:unnamed protein product [Ananas comosus var. bracteatus]